jgi:hypothetical protein
MKQALRTVWISLSCILSFNTLNAQDNYEIQVYESPTVLKGYTMVELHSNYTFNGTTSKINGVNPTNHILHETVEITHGFANNFEIGFYFFNAFGSDNRTAYVGSHIRPRFTAPQGWNLPFGLSLSTEVGYQKRAFCEDDWTVEIRPIIDKTFGKAYFSLNPTLEKSLHGLNSNSGFVFSPNFKVRYAFTNHVAPALEYYGSVGPFRQFLPWGEQDEQLFIAADLNVSPLWEINVGYGFGLNHNTDRNIIKLILGRRLSPHHSKEPNE